MRIIELFAGIGACSKALKNIGIDVDIVDAVEIDKYAIKSFNAIHGTNFDVQDIMKWDKYYEDIDMITHGSPCQDFSVAGKQAGGDIGSGTRSSLMYETIRIVGKIRPKYVLWENVKNLLSKKHKHNFDSYIETMNTLGYNSYYQVLNAKDYGVPQNRERVYAISIRKDIDKGNFKFPEKEGLKLRLKDILEDKVDEKYYLSDEQVNKIQTSNFMQEKKRIQEKEYSDTILARDWKDPKCVRIGGIFDTENSKHQAGSIYDKEGLSPTLDVMQGGWRQPSILENNFISNRQPKVLELNKNAKHQQDLIQHEDGLCRTIPAGTHGSTPHLLKTAILEGQSGLIQPVDRNYKEHKLKRETHVEFKSDDCSHALRTSVIPVTAVLKDGVDITWNKMGNTTDISKALTTACRTLSKNQMATGVLEIQINKIEIPQNLRIRKLTPKECWRLMAFSDEDFEKAQSVPTSNTQLYKQARKFNCC